MASWAASGIQIGVSSPARCSFASISASRRSVFTRSPALTGINDGATTTQSCPTAWAGLIAEAQATPRFAQPRRQLRQNLGTVLENPELADLAAAATLRNRHSDR